MTTCCVCLLADGFSCTGKDFDGSLRREECDVCGWFVVTREAKDDFLDGDRRQVTKAVRAALSHWIRQRQVSRNSDDLIRVTSETVEAAIEGKISIPNASQQATNAIRFVGDHTRDTGEPMEELPPSFSSAIGSISRNFALSIAIELEQRGIFSAINSATHDGIEVADIALTLTGWDHYELEQRGRVEGNYGFIALKFGDTVLDPFLRDHIKPAVAELGYELRDMRDVSRAGLIDNLMRIEIRDAAFVIVDLTHDNSGAYWEAGYAEGLGKPVLYICEHDKFSEAQTHFDTNHCTTVMWSAGNPEIFRANLIATLRRSL